MGWLSNLFGGTSEEPEVIGVITDQDQSDAFMEWLLADRDRARAAFHCDEEKVEPAPEKGFWGKLFS
jgi:hypothetical protein